jgi:hypothetical protein
MMTYLSEKTDGKASEQHRLRTSICSDPQRAVS